MKIVSKIGKKTLVMSVIAIIAFSFIGGAALVNYLSNEVTATVDVDSPPVKLETRAGTSGTWYESGEIDLGAAYGTETSTFQIKVTKLAEDNPDKADDYTEYGPQISGTLSAEVYCPDGISTGLQEFDEVRIKFWDGQDYESETYNLDDFTVTRINNNRVTIEGLTEILWDQWGYYGQFEIDWNQYATGSYEITMQII